ncbi:MAG: sugar ABC transporter permease YjfF, partial [Desulfosporosinus sp.]
MKNSKAFSKFSLGNITVFAAIVIFMLFFAVGSITYKDFFSTQIFLNLIIDNAHLLIVAFGATLVLITGGIDLSIGA